MRSFIVILLFLASFLQLCAIETTELKTLFESIYQKKTDSEKLSANKEFRRSLETFLKENDAMEVDLSDLKMFSKKEPKSMFRIFNWNVPLEDKNHYECLFAVRKKDGTNAMITCKSSKRDLMKSSNRAMSSKDWPGALYYEIIPLSKKDVAQFALLGWEGNNEMSNRKVIEIISVNEKNIRFGANYFNEFERPIKRFVMEYRDDVVVGMTYDPKFKRVVFDHLSPPRPDLKGQFQFYGPDMTFDAFVLKKGQFYFREDVKFLRERNDKDANFYDPRGK